MTKLLLLISSVALAAAASAQQVAYNNYGEPGDTYDSSNGWVVTNGAVIGFPQWLADGFSVSQTSTLDYVQFSIGFDNGSGGQLDYGIWTNSGGTPGTELASGTVTDTGNGTYQVTMPITMSAGSYMFSLGTTDPNLYCGWDMNSTGATGFATSQDDGGSWFTNDGSTSPVMKVVVNPQNATPGPAAALPFGAAVLGFIRRRKLA